MSTKGRVIVEPDILKDFRAKYPDECEPFTIWVHTDVKDFEWDSYGASAGFIPGETKVTILDRLEVTFEAGPFNGKTIPLLKIRGPNLVGKEITGWALERDINQDN
jgi:hypothetical protein